VQVGGVDAEQFRRLGEVARGLVERGENYAHLLVADGFVVAANQARPVWRAFEHGFRQVFRQDKLGCAQHDGALDGVFEVADVAGPVVRLETGECFARNASYLRRARLPCLTTKYLASRGMSSRRSRNGGTVRDTTLRR